MLLLNGKSCIRHRLAADGTVEKEVGRGGFEPPTHGFSVHCTGNTSLDRIETCESPKTQLTQNSQKQGKIDTSELSPDHVEVVTVWPELPDHIKAATKALIRSHMMEVK